MTGGTASTQASNRISSYILYVVIAAAPLPLGSRDAITVAVWCCLLGIGLLFASPRDLRPPHKAILAVIALVVACFAFVLHEQLSAHPWIAQPNPIWDETSRLLGRRLPPLVSIVRSEPFYTLGPSLAAVLALVLGLIVGTDDARARFALFVFGWSGVAYAIYGMTVLLGQVTGFAAPQRGGELLSLTATFINRNTTAAYLGSCAALWLILLLSKVRRRLPRTVVWRELPRQLLSETLIDRDTVMRMSAFFVCLIALFMTLSRAGVIVSLVGMAVALALFVRSDLPRGKGVIVLIVGAGAALVLLEVLGGAVEGRIDAAGLTDQGRWEAYRSTLRMIADRPWFGNGLGTFAWAFPPYRSGNISVVGIWDLAHSTPLELAAELGVPLAALIAAAWIAAFVVLFRGAGRSRRVTVAPLAALVAALIANLHSAVDFSLQVPGYAIVIFALTGVGLSQSFASEPSQHRRRSRRSASSEDVAAQKTSGGAVTD